MVSQGHATAPVIDASFHNIYDAETHVIMPLTPYIFFDNSFWIPEIGQVDLVLSPHGDIVAVDQRARIFERLQ